MQNGVRPIGKDDGVNRLPAAHGGFWLTLALMVGYSFVYMDQSMFSLTVMPLERRFGLDTGQTGLIMSLFFLGYSLTQIPCGWFADRVGVKAMLLVSLAVCGLFAFVFGAMGGMLLFCVVRFASGLGHGGYPPSCSKLVSQRYASSRRTFVQSLLISTSGIGGVLAYTVGARMVSTNWRTAYMVLGVCYVVAFILVWVFVPGRSKVTGESRQTVDKRDGRSGSVGLAKVLKDRNVIVLFCVMLLLNVVLFGNMSWQASYMTSRFHMSSVDAGWILAANTVVCAIASLGSGSLLTRFFPGREKAAIAVTSGIGAVLTVLFAFCDSLPVAAVLMLCSSLAIMFAFTAAFSWPQCLMEPHVIGSSIGVINTGSTVGGILAPIVTGEIVKLSGGSFTPAFLFLAASCLLTVAVVQLVRVNR